MACSSPSSKSSRGTPSPDPDPIPAPNTASDPTEPPRQAARVDCDKRPENQRASFAAHGTDLVMTGEVDRDTPSKLAAALRAHPKARRIVMECVPGSRDDDANLKAARMVRAARLHTHIVSGGMVASGGTDFFLSGVERTIGEDVYIGVHSWSGDDVGPPAKLPRSHPEHRKYLAYYREMGIPTAFYWFTLNAAPADGMHDMTDAELERYKVITK